jgi:hypothetical protein
MQATWAKQQKKPKPPPPIDFEAIKAAVTKIAEGKTKLNFGQVWKAAVAAAPAIQTFAMDGTSSYIVRHLRTLGFTPSKSLNTFTRPDAPSPV